MEIDESLLLGVVGLLMVLSALLVLPYAQFVLAAALIAFVLLPIHRRLSSHVRETVSATIVVVGAVFALLLPFVVIAVVVAGDVVTFARSLEDRNLDFSIIEEPIANYTGLEVDVGGAVRSALSEGAIYDSAMSAFGVATHLVIGFGLLVFLLFFFVRSGDAFVGWIRKVSPLPEPVLDELVTRLDHITNAVLAGHVLVAIIQGTLAGLAFAVLGIPNTILWTFVMIFLSLIPVVGSFLIWAPASLYLFSQGQTVPAVALFVYGSTLVAIADDYLRPVITDRYAQISPSVMIVGVIGGISVYGFMGLFVGPIIVGMLKETIEVYDEYYGSKHSVN